MTKEDKQNIDPRLVKLSNGREVRIDLNGLNWREVRELTAGVPMFDALHPEASASAEYRHAELKGKACGLTADEVLALGFGDFSLISKRVTDLIVNPVEADPN